MRMEEPIDYGFWSEILRYAHCQAKIELHYMCLQAENSN